MDPLITKRLHISGLTPNLTPEDLSKRLSSFGTVKALDGFGLSDGVGQPRKFGYVTIEATPSSLAKCLNLLSGSTWKGAKLRIGDAKPDFQERLARDRESNEDPPKKRKRQRGAQAVHAADMSLVTPANVRQRAGWTLTPLGRMMRPVKMRPARPLVAQSQKSGDEAGVVGVGVVKKKEGRREGDVRARRRAIDMGAWGSVYLKGAFLDVYVVDPVIEGKGVGVGVGDEESGDGSGDSEGTDGGEEEELVTLPIVASTESTRAALPDDNTDVALEKNQSLDILRSLFGDKDDRDWTGRESVGSDIDETELKKGGVILEDGEVDQVEEVPMDVDTSTLAPVSPQLADDEEREALPPSIPEKTHVPTLKDLFAPQQAEAGFSLLSHLDLDLELDDEVLFPSPTQTLPVNTNTASAPHAHPQPSALAPPTLDPKQPLFFPHPSSFPFNDPGTSSTKAKSKDLFDVARDNAWNWRDPNPSVGFYRTATEEEVRRRWESQKVELTREWKRRWREAGKIRRRRGGGVGDGE